MKCYKCGKGMSNGKSMFPIDPKGKNRRWSCTDCTSPVGIVPQDVIEICEAINPDFNTANTSVNVKEEKEVYYVDSEYSVRKGIHKGIVNLGCRDRVLINVFDSEYGENVLIHEDFVFDTESEALEIATN